MKIINYMFFALVTNKIDRIFNYIIMVDCGIGNDEIIFQFFIEKIDAQSSKHIHLCVCVCVTFEIDE